MKPGIVLISLTRTAPSGSTKKSQRARPEQPARRKAATASSRTRSVAARRDRRRDRPAPCRPRRTWPRSRTTRRGRRSRPAARPRRPRCRAPSTRPRGPRRRPRRSPAGRGAAPARPPRRARSRLLDPADADARAQPRGLHPERQAQRLAALAPARASPTATKSTCGTPLLGEEPLQGQLVHADRRGEHVGADVGDVEPLEQALDAAVLAEGPVQGREDGVGAEQAARRGQLDRLAVAAPAPVAARSSPRTASWPASSQAARRPPRPSAARRRARRSGRRRGPRPSLGFFFGFRFGAPRRACRRRSSPSAPGSSFGARRRELVGDAADLARGLRFLLPRPSGSGRLRAPLRTASARSLPITFGTFACFFALGDDDRDGRARFDLAAGARRLADHLARRAASLSSSATLGVEAAAADLLHGEARAGVPTRTGTLASFGPAGDDERRRSSRGSRSSPPDGFGVDHQRLLRPLSELTRFDLRLRSRPLRASSSLRPRSGRRSPGTLALPGPALTVSVTFGFEQKKVRKAQSSVGLVAGRRGGGSCSSTVFGRRFALDPLDVADLEAVLLRAGRSRR